MMTTLDNATVAEMRQSAPDLFAQVDALRAAGKPIARVVLDEDTGEVFLSEGPDQPYVKANGIIREMMTGIPCPHPGRLNPLASKRALGDPGRKARHDAKARSMLVDLVEYYAPKLARDPRAGKVFDIIVASIERNRSVLTGLLNNYARWEVIVENTIDLLEGMQAAGPVQAED
ncbi:hypothetical protein MKK75_11055 [Methylobacterium sp. J-030]|uniref:hypothetical protein n=1 Tax=Methylobacterium sp. J-030 TaxID=2836627 RepID=UPI001FBA0A4E|nr:hypothetical protein [Methylobacterium sp. J-030]MCJ2069332.1 hypothetical protein [Methylobacterium sp. J-030]